MIDVMRYQFFPEEQATRFPEPSIDLLDPDLDESQVRFDVTVQQTRHVLGMTVADLREALGMPMASPHDLWVRLQTSEDEGLAELYELGEETNYDVAGGAYEAGKD